MAHGPRAWTRLPHERSARPAGKKRTFAVLDDHEQPAMLCLVVKADPERQADLVDNTRFFPSKFGATHGWTAMRVDALTHWQLAEELVIASYRRVALKRMLAALDASAPAPARHNASVEDPHFCERSTNRRSELTICRSCPPARRRCCRPLLDVTEPDSMINDARRRMDSARPPP